MHIEGTLGNARVSRPNQCLSVQRNHPLEAGTMRVSTEVACGKRWNDPGLAECVVPARSTTPASDRSRACGNTVRNFGPAAHGTSSAEAVYLITSLDARAASPADLLALNRGHWAVENRRHRVRDTALGEDACLARTGNGPLNRASLNTIALRIPVRNPG